MIGIARKIRHCRFYISLHLILGQIDFGFRVGAGKEHLKRPSQASSIAERQVFCRCGTVCLARRSMANQVGLQAIKSDSQIRGNMGRG